MPPGATAPMCRDNGQATAIPSPRCAPDSPDGKFILGPVPGLSGFLVAGGCCGSGVAGSGGFGLSIAELIMGREPTIDIGIYRPDRFGIVDPASQAFRDRCAAARAGKSRGNIDS